MRKHLLVISFAAFISIFSASCAFADTFTASVQNLSPGNSVVAKNKLTFSITATGFQAQTYHVTDSFVNTSISNTNIDGGGNFLWVPSVSDVGTHVLTVSPQDFSGDSASTQLTITVLPPPSISIQSVSSKTMVAGQKFTFSVVQNGFTNPTYVVGDAFSGSSAVSQGVDASGNFSWTPELSQNGKHTITIYASDSLGHSSQASVDVQIGAGPSLLIQPITPGTTINAGTTVSFTVAAINIIPTGFSVLDSFAGGSISNANINTSGNFVWTPSGSDVGTHVLSFKGQVGAYGDSATTTQTLIVVPSGASTSSPPVSATNTSNSSNASNSLLSTLQAQLAALTSKITNQSGAAAPAAHTGYVFTSYLKPGMRGDEVMQLQQTLAGLGLLTAKPNGYFGVGTTAAVKEFQKEHGLDQLGSVGPGTRAALNSLDGSTAAPVSTAPTAASTGTFKFEHFLGYGDDDSPDVTQLQMFLQSLGYLPANAPLGFYGSATEAAVKKYQSSKGLPTSGYVDSRTRAAINQ